MECDALHPATYQCFRSKSDVALCSGQSWPDRHGNELHSSQISVPSIRRKISFGFYLFAATIAVLAMLAYSDLLYLEQRIEAGVPVHDFLNAALQLRRYEKNHYLYGTQENFDTARGFAKQTADILERQQRAFVVLSGERAPREADTLLRRFTDQLAAYGSSGPEDACQRTHRAGRGGDPRPGNRVHMPGTQSHAG